MKSQDISLEQAASLCGVSIKRMQRWIEKKELQVVDPSAGDARLEPAEIIDFLVRHNIPLPDSIVPFRAKKILFIYSDTADSRVFMKFLITFLRQLRKRQVGFIADHTMFGVDAKMKVMVFRPDVVILDMTEKDDDAIAMSMAIRKLEEFCTPKIIAMASSDTLECNRKLALDCGIDEVTCDNSQIESLVVKSLSLE